MRDNFLNRKITWVLMMSLGSACNFLGKSETASSPWAAQFTQKTEQGQAYSVGIGTIGIMNVDQLVPTLVQATDVTPTAQVPGSMISLNDQFTAIKGLLSTAGSAADVNPTMILVMTGMVGSACRILITNEAAAASGARKITGPVNFTAGPAGLTPAVRNTVLMNYFRMWNRRDATAEELNILSETLDEAISAQGSAGTATKKVQDVLMIPCVAACGPECMKS